MCVAMWRDSGDPDHHIVNVSVSSVFHCCILGSVRVQGPWKDYGLELSIPLYDTIHSPLVLVIYLFHGSELPK